jgi:hypothetical protein
MYEYLTLVKEHTIFRACGVTGGRFERVAQVSHQTWNGGTWKLHAYKEGKAACM